MTTQHDAFADVIEAWLDIAPAAEDPGSVLDRVVAEVEVTRQQRRSWLAPWSVDVNRFIAVGLATGAVLVAALIGLQVLSGQSMGAPGPGDPDPTEFRTPSPVPSTSVGPIDVPYHDVGIIGLPPPGAAPSSPTRSELVESFWLPRTPRDYGEALLYADGRLIWLEFYDGASTGYLEQRLTPEGVELVRALASEPNPAPVESKRLDPRQLPDLLPANAWADITIRPYVPSGFAACLVVEDDDPFQIGSLVLTMSEMLAILPAAASDILRDRDAVLAGDDPSDCLEMTIEEARQLDGALRGAGLAQDESRNRYLLEYHILLDSLAPDGWRLGVWFEPILPDGTIGRSSGG